MVPRYSLRSMLPGLLRGFRRLCVIDGQTWLLVTTIRQPSSLQYPKHIAIRNCTYTRLHSFCNPPPPPSFPTRISVSVVTTATTKRHDHVQEFASNEYSCQPWRTLIQSGIVCRIDLVISLQRKALAIRPSNCHLCRNILHCSTDTRCSRSLPRMRSQKTKSDPFDGETHVKLVKLKFEILDNGWCDDRAEVYNCLFNKYSISLSKRALVNPAVISHSTHSQDYKTSSVSNSISGVLTRGR